jgi:hypothetical protein
MQLKLGIRRPVGDAAKDRLDVIERLAPRARDIGHQPFPTGTPEQCIQCRQAAAQRRADRHAASDGVALLLLPRLQPSPEDRRSKPGEFLLRKQVPEDDITVAVEFLPVLGRH